tara:strand:+ start:2973 stop:3689 length:717 start_codon:yes stop_codon:yes gene_type:complete
MNQSERTDLITAAIGEAQANMSPVVADSENPFFKSTYADLAGIMKTIKNALTDAGVVPIQGVMPPSFEGGAPVLRTRLSHSSGQFIEDYGVPLILEKKTMQQMGSAITYARRQGLTAMLGITVVGEDDDAAVASNTLYPRTQPKAENKKPMVKKMEGPIKTKTELKKQLDALVSDIVSCDDVDQLRSLHQSTPTRELMDQAKMDWPEAYSSERSETNDVIGVLEHFKEHHEKLEASAP